MVSEWGFATRLGGSFPPAARLWQSEWIIQAISHAGPGAFGASDLPSPPACGERRWVPDSKIGDSYHSLAPACGGEGRGEGGFLPSLPRPRVRGRGPGVRGSSFRQGPHQTNPFAPGLRNRNEPKPEARNEANLPDAVYGANPFFRTKHAERLRERRRNSLKPKSFGFRAPGTAIRERQRTEAHQTASRPAHLTRQRPAAGPSGSGIAGGSGRPRRR